MQPTKTNVLKKSLIEAMQKSFGIVTTACKIVGCNRSTFYDYYNNDAEFKKSIDEIENIALDYAESQLFKRLDKSDTLLIFYLKTKGKKRGYIERQEVETTIKNGLNIQVNSPIIAEDINKLNEII